MINAVKSFDPVTAAGILSRAALSVGYLDDPIGDNSISRRAKDDKLIARVIDEARDQLGLTPDDNDPNSFDKIADLLDEEAEKLASPRNTKAALFRMAARGDLPSDLYEIEIIPNVADIYGKQFALEKELIETTIRAPNLEQHYGPSSKPNEPTMISLFLKSFQTTWPLRNFSIVVAAQRDGFRLVVHQAWRIYPSVVKLDGVGTPIDWLRKFADVYGSEIEVEGKKGHFFLIANGPIPNMFTYRQTVTQSTKKRQPEATISRFTQRDPITKQETSAFIVAIDIQKYLRTLKEFGVRRENILERFVPAPKPHA